VVQARPPRKDVNQLTGFQLVVPSSEMSTQMQPSAYQRTVRLLPRANTDPARGSDTEIAWPRPRSSDWNG